MFLVDVHFIFSLKSVGVASIVISMSKLNVVAFISGILALPASSFLDSTHQDKYPSTAFLICEKGDHFFSSLCFVCIIILNLAVY